MNKERRGYRYYFTRQVKSPADMPKLPEKWYIYKKQSYVPLFERDTWGWVEYDRPLQQCDIEDFKLIEEEYYMKRHEYG